MMGGPPGMSGMPDAPPIDPISLGKKSGAKKEKLPNLVDDNNGKSLPRLVVNKTYHLYLIVTNFCKKALWFGSCLGLMYFFPMMIEYMGE